MEFLEQLLNVELGLPARFLIAFVFVLLLIALTAWIIRRLAAGRSALVGGLRARQHRITVIDSAGVDAKRRLVLVRWDNSEHLLLVGGQTDIVVDSTGRRAERPETAEVRAPALEEQPRPAAARAVEPPQPRERQAPPRPTAPAPRPQAAAPAPRAEPTAERPRQPAAARPPQQNADEAPRERPSPFAALRRVTGRGNGETAEQPAQDRGQQDRGQQERAPERAQPERPPQRGPEPTVTRPQPQPQRPAGNPVRPTGDQPRPQPQRPSGAPGNPPAAGTPPVPGAPVASPAPQRDQRGTQAETATGGESEEIDEMASRLEAALRRPGGDAPAERPSGEREGQPVQRPAGPSAPAQSPATSAPASSAPSPRPQAPQPAPARSEPPAGSRPPGAAPRPQERPASQGPENPFAARPVAAQPQRPAQPARPEGQPSREGERSEPAPARSRATDFDLAAAMAAELDLGPERPSSPSRNEASRSGSTSGESGSDDEEKSDNGDDLNIYEQILKRDT